MTTFSDMQVSYVNAIEKNPQQHQILMNLTRDYLNDLNYPDDDDYACFLRGALKFAEEIKSFVASSILIAHLKSLT